MYWFLSLLPTPLLPHPGTCYLPLFTAPYDMCNPWCLTSKLLSRQPPDILVWTGSGTHIQASHDISANEIGSRLLLVRNHFAQNQTFQSFMLRPSEFCRQTDRQIQTGVVSLPQVSFLCLLRLHYAPLQRYMG